MAEQTARIVITATDQSKAAFDSAVRGIDAFKASASSLSGVLAGVASGLGALAVVAQFQSFVKGAAALDDMAEKTGATVENLSALAAVARVSGTAIETVEGGLIKFAKALNGVDDETKKAGQAFAALGLDPSKLRTLDTAEAFKVLAESLNKFKDDGSKTAAVLEILGKSGAQLLPYLKDLAETGDLQAKVTAEQAAQAENLEKNLNRLFATKSAGLREFNAAVLPTVDEFVKAMLNMANASDGARVAIRRFAQDGTIQTWAEGVADVVAIVVDSFVGVRKAIVGAGESLAVFAQMAKAALTVSVVRKDNMFAGLQFGDTEQLAKIRAAAQDRAQEVWGGKSFRDRLAEVRAEAAANRAGQEEGADARGGRSSLNFQATKDVSGVSKFKDELRIVDAFVDSIGQRLVSQTEGEFEMLRQRTLDVFGKVDFSKLNAKDFDRFVEKLATVNLAIDELEERAVNAGWSKALSDSFKLAADAAERADEAVRNFNQTQSAAAQDMEFELAMVGKLTSERQKLAAARRIDLDAQRAVASIPEGAENRDERIADIYKLAAESKERTGAMFDAIRDKSRDTFTGLSSAAADYFDRVTNGAENVRTLFNRAFQSMEDALVKFTMTGKLDFKEMANSIIADIIRIQVRQSITAPIAKAIGGGGGGGFDLGGIFNKVFGGGDGGWSISTGGAGGIDGWFADGGRPRVGRVSMVGERGPELFVPDVAGTVIPNESLGGPSIMIHQTINPAPGNDRNMMQGMMLQAKDAAVREITAKLANRGYKDLAGALA